MVVVMESPLLIKPACCGTDVRQLTALAAFRQVTRVTGGGAAVDIDIPATWEQSAADIIRHQWRTVLIIGAVDRGKSTYCQFLSQRLLVAGFGWRWWMPMLGRKILARQRRSRWGTPEAAQHLTEVQPTALYFVGAVSPVGHLLPMVIGTQQLVERATLPLCW